MGVLVNQIQITDETLTIDQAVDKIATRASFCLVLVFIVAVCSQLNTACQTYITIFTGYIPYQDWICTSQKCYGLEAASNGSLFYTEASMCDNELVAGEDFNWTSTRTTFSQDWGIYCGNEAKLSVASSFFFVGACLGLLTATALFDRIGRRNGAVVGSVISFVATLLGTWVPSYELLLVIRVFQGFGQFISFTGVYCWVVEFAPTQLRGSINALVLIAWAFGYLVIVLVGFLLPTWQHIFLAVAIINIVTIIPLLILPQSPRFALVMGREEEAKKTLEAYSRVCGNPVSLEGVRLVYEERKQNFLEQLKDFKDYPVMMKETGLCMVCWFVVACLFYGFSFGWGKISSAVHESYLYAALGKVIAFTMTIPACKWIGRRYSMLVFVGCGILSNLLAMPDVELGSGWTLEYVACLIGSIAISAAFCVVYLLTSELAPTTHRGMIMSLSSASARVGSFIGPYVSILYTVTDRRVPLAVFAAASVVCCVAVFFLPDTTGKPIPETPADVVSRSKGYRAVDTEI